MAKDVGFLCYEGLPGSTLTGCMNSPAYNSRFSNDHQEYVCNLQVASDKNGIIGPVTRARAQLQGQIPEKVRVVEKILDSMVTRSNTYYKVCSRWQTCIIRQDLPWCSRFRCSDIKG